jgi:hypothetical protein
MVYLARLAMLDYKALQMSASRMPTLCIIIYSFIILMTVAEVIIHWVHDHLTHHQKFRHVRTSFYAILFFGRSTQCRLGFVIESQTPQFAAVGFSQRPEN